jgi:hypothetical protein
MILIRILKENVATGLTESICVEISNLINAQELLIM